MKRGEKNQTEEARASEIMSCKTFSTQTKPVKGFQFLFVWLTDWAVIMVIDSGMCPFVLCNSVQQDNITRSHDTDLRQLYTQLLSHSSGLLIIDLQGHLSELARDSADIVGLNTA